ncbi:MAG: protein BatD [Cryomorphaceae bacterium]|nr:protein BatD [Cryomorphaceae bacterium]MBL6683004.1 protein BatD [Cryomorphaceae bacterium]
MEKKIGKYYWLWAFIFLATSLVAQEVQLTARSSRTSVGLDEPFRVTFSCNARGGDLIPPSFEHFIVVSGPYSSQQTQIINGSMSFSRELTYQLVAQEEGTFTIDPATLKIKGKEFQSNRLTIEVKAGVRKERSQSVPKSAGFEVEILSSKKAVYVGEPIVLLFSATLFEQVRDLNMLQAPNFENVLQQQLEFEQQSRRERIGGKIATVLDFDKRLIIPNKPGTLGGQELKITGTVQKPTGQRDFFNMPLMRWEQEVATAKIPAVKIKPLPTPQPSGFSGAVGELKLVREVSRTSVNGDESITLKLRIEGAGNFNTISVPELIPPQGFDLYDPKFNEKIRYSERGVRGFKEFEYLLVPQFKGQFILPQMEWTFFNTKKEAYETITLEETTLTVTGDALVEAEPNNDGASPKIQREVNTIDSDIRYLQEVDESNTEHGKSLLWIWVLLGGVVLGWLLQLVSIKSRSASPEAMHAALKKAINTAWKTNDPEAVGKMLNALEEALVRKGIAKENISLTVLNEAFGTASGGRINALVEQLQLALYAPNTMVSNDEWLNEFNALWEQL